MTGSATGPAGPVRQACLDCFGQRGRGPIRVGLAGQPAEVLGGFEEQSRQLALGILHTRCQAGIEVEPGDETLQRGLGRRRPQPVHDGAQMDPQVRQQFGPFTPRDPGPAGGEGDEPLVDLQTEIGGTDLGSQLRPKAPLQIGVTGRSVHQELGQPVRAECLASGRRRAFRHHLNKAEAGRRSTWRWCSLIVPP